MGSKDTFPVVKCPECKVDHSPPSSDEVFNEWNYTTTPS